MQGGAWLFGVQHLTNLMEAVPQLQSEYVKVSVIQRRWLKLAHLGLNRTLVTGRLKVLAEVQS